MELFSRKKRLANKESFVGQIDLIETQWLELCKDYAELRTAFSGLRFRRVQLKKQIENLMAEIDGEKDD